MLSHRLPLLFTFISLFALVLAGSNSTCYYPNGVANHGASCHPDADESVCCGPTFVCLSNGLCQVGPDTRQTHAYKFYRSGCTDPTFTSPSCPQICTGPGYRLDSGQGLQNCGNDQYCCAENYDCCTNSTNIFSLGIGNIITTIPAMSAPTESSQPSSPSGPSKSVAIGAGVGAGVGGLLVICVALLLFLRRRRQKSSPGLEGTETAELDSAGLTKYAGPQDVKVGYSAESSPPQIQHELASNERYRPQEMDGNIPYELDGSETEPRDGGVRTYDESSVEESRPQR